MDPQEFAGDYFADEADLEGSLDLPVLGHLESEPRFYQRQEGLTGLAPDPRVSERLYYFVKTDLPAVWVVGLGQAGEELPVAVGLAECAAAAAAPILVIGPEAQSPLGMAPVSLRPVHPGAFEEVLTALFPEGCGAQASGIQGVMRAWPGGDEAQEALTPGGLVIASHGSAEALEPPPTALTGVVIVVPYRDVPAQVIVEQLRKLRAREYPLLGIVAVTAPGLTGGRPNRGIAPKGDITAEEPAATADGEGGIMNEGGSQRAVNADEEIVDAHLQTSSDGEPVPEEGQERVAAKSTWSDSFGSPGGRRRGPAGGRGRIPWWVTVLVLVAVGCAGLLITRMLRVESSDDFAGGDAATVVAEEPVMMPTEGEVAQPAELPAVEPAVTPEEAPVATPVETPGAPAEPAGRPLSGVNAPPYVIQCGAFRSSVAAQREAQRLEALGLDARVVAVSFPARGVLNRIVVGRSDNLAQARELARRAIAEGWLKEAVVVADDGAGPAVGAPIKAE